MTAPPDEFAWIESLRALTRGDPRALGLADDAAVLPARPGFDLVVSTDAMVEGVHFLEGERPQIIARRLLRTSLSDLAAKAARPFGYLLTTAWPPDRSWAWRRAFTQGLAEDGDEFGVALLGGETVATPGPLTLSATVFGWTSAGRTVLRSTARAGDAVVVCGVIGDGWLGLRAARGEIADPGGRLQAHYRTPRPLLALRDLLSTYARAAADVSDGLLADVGHVAEASGLGVRIDLEQLPLSISGAAWCEAQDEEVQARLRLASGGDDYAIVCAVAPQDEDPARRGIGALGVPAARVGVFMDGGGLDLRLRGAPITLPDTLGWRH
jgi:thiamine-monophosphate kinase